MDWNSFISAIIGGGLAIIGVFIANWLNSKSEQGRKKDEIKALIQSIRDEIIALTEIYKDSVGNTLEKHEDGTPFKHYFNVTQEYFTVYSSNAGKIGMIEDDELRKSIITAYSAGRSLIDTFNTNNDTLRTYDQSQSLFNITKNEAYREQADYLVGDMSAYSISLKGKHTKFIDAVEFLLNNIDHSKH